MTAKYTIYTIEKTCTKASKILPQIYIADFVTNDNTNYLLEDNERKLLNINNGQG